MKAERETNKERQIERLTDRKKYSRNELMNEKGNKGRQRKAIEGRQKKKVSMQAR